MTYTLNNPTEQHLTKGDLAKEATTFFTKTYKGKIYTTFVVAQDVYIVVNNGDIYKSLTITRNIAEMWFYGSVELKEERILELKNALKIISNVTK